MSEPQFIKEQVIEALGGVPAAAQFFQIRRQAIYQWPPGEPIPPRRQLEIQLRRPDLLNGKNKPRP